MLLLMIPSPPRSLSEVSILSWLFGEEEGKRKPSSELIFNAMKGLQKAKYRPQMARAQDLDLTGFEVQPLHVIIGTVGFVITVIFLHFFGKMTA